MTRHHVGKESNDKCQRLGKDTKELDERHQWNRYLQPHRYVRPEDVLPILLCTGEIGDKERRNTKEACACDVARKITSSRWERNDTHQIGKEDKEETGQQPWCVLRRLFSHACLDDIVVDVHYEHVHQSRESLWSRVANLMALAPACRKQYAQE